MNPVRVASVPFSQVYIRHCGPLPGEEETFVRLPDPAPRRGDGTEQSGWWPPAMLEEGWVDEAADIFDLMHIHFGFDALGPQDLQRVVDDLRRHGKPLVYTVHDLRNPHHTDPAAHDAALDVIIPAADALVTLTQGAAQQVRARWGRDATVLPHPHVVGLEKPWWSAPERTPGDPFVVGVHLKSLRPNMRPEIVDALVAAAADLPGTVVQVNAHPDVMAGETPRAAAVAARVTELAEAGAIDLQVNPYFDEDRLWAYLASLDVSVLPYGWGTHSGWLEACVDLGTAVAAPDCGFYRDQRPLHGFHMDRHGLDQESLVSALRAARERGRGFRMSRAERVEERRQVAAAHTGLYRSLL